METTGDTEQMDEAYRWIIWARKLQAASQTGLHFSSDPYDRERYEQIAEIAAEMFAANSPLEAREVRSWNREELGYETPKVDVRGVVFQDDRLLLVREVSDRNRWTLPGGWADVTDAPSAAIEREVFEESGYEVKAVELLALYDRDTQGHLPPLPHQVYKVFFRCEVVGGAAQTSRETSEVAFFSEDQLPLDQLSEERVLPAQLLDFFRRAASNPGPAAFD